MIPKTSLIFSVLLLSLSAQASDFPSSIKSGVPYEEAKASLMADGWKPLVNSKITNSSLYAQEIFEKGSTEVVDCISMEIDGCTFRYIKNKKILEIRTITRDLKVDKINLINKK
jgi:hypothetical protein